MSPQSLLLSGNASPPPPSTSPLSLARLAGTVMPFKSRKDERVCSIEHTGGEVRYLSSRSLSLSQTQRGSHTRGIRFESQPRLLVFHHSSSTLIRRERKTQREAGGGEEKMLRESEEEKLRCIRLEAERARRMKAKSEKRTRKKGK